MPQLSARNIAFPSIKFYEHHHTNQRATAYVTSSPLPSLFRQTRARTRNICLFSKLNPPPRPNEATLIARFLFRSAVAA